MESTFAMALFGLEGMTTVVPGIHRSTLKPCDPTRMHLEQFAADEPDRTEDMQVVHDMETLGV